MAREPDVDISMTVFGSLANRKVSPDIPSKSKALQAMLSTLTTNHASLIIILY